MLFSEAVTQFDAGRFDLRIQLARFHRTFEQLQRGHQFRHGANLHGGFALAELNSASTVAQMECQFASVSGPRPQAARNLQLFVWLKVVHKQKLLVVA